MAETKKVTEEKPKNILGKLKEAVDDKEEQLDVLSNTHKSYCSYLVCRNFNFKLR